MTAVDAAPSTPPRTDPVPTDGPVLPEAPDVVDEVVVEDVSIDGMCGVY